MIKQGVCEKESISTNTQQSNRYQIEYNLLRRATDSPPHHRRARSILNLKRRGNEGVSKSRTQ